MKSTDLLNLQLRIGVGSNRIANIEEHALLESVEARAGTSTRHLTGSIVEQYLEYTQRTTVLLSEPESSGTKRLAT